MKIEVERIGRALTSLLMDHGANFADAELTAQILLEGDLRGYPTHGSERIFQIIEGVQRESINLKAKWEIIKENETIAIIDGHHCLGQPLGHYAMMLASDKAKKCGVGVVGVTNSGHLGVLSYYSELVVQHACIGVVLTTSSPAAVLKGGSIATWGTNPISYSIPTGGRPIIADFSTSKVSRGTILRYLNEGKNIPIAWAVDEFGAATNDPVKALKGGIQTIDGDIKGSLISLMVSVLAGQLIGGVANHEVRGTRDTSQFSNKGDLFLVFHVPTFTDFEKFSEKNNSLCEFIQAQNSAFRIPGSKSYHLRQQHLVSGLEIGEKLALLLQQYL